MATEYGVNFDTVGRTFADTAIVIPRIREGGYSSEYLSKQDGFDVRVSIAHSVEKSTKYERHLLKLTRVTPQPDGPDLLEEMYVVLRGPKTMGIADAEKLRKNLVAWLTEGNLVKLFGWQS